MSSFLQYNDLMKKRRIVFNDKMKITAVIAELDLKKNEALKKAHLQVNKVGTWTVIFTPLQSVDMFYLQSVVWMTAKRVK